MILDDDNDCILITDSKLYISNKDGLLCFLKDYLSGLPADEFKEAADYIDSDPSEETDLNMLGFEDMMRMYMCLDEISPTGEFFVKCEHAKNKLLCFVKGNDIYDPFAKWKEIAEFFDGWIEWKNTYNNRKFRYVFASGTMEEEESVFLSDGMFKQGE